MQWLNMEDSFKPLLVELGWLSSLSTILLARSFIGAGADSCSGHTQMLTIRTAKIEDVTVLKSLICELAEYEHEPDSVVLTEEDLRRDGFCGNPRYRVLLAEWNGEPVGYALFFGIYSSWDGPGIFLEDLFVRPSFRKREIGRSLMSAVARIAKQENCFGIRWEVLDWNSPAIAFYKSIGAEFLEQWRGASLKGKALRHLAKEV